MLICVGNNEILMSRYLVDDIELKYYIVDTETFRVQVVTELGLRKALAIGEDIKNLKVIRTIYQEDVITGLSEEFISCPLVAESEDFIISIKLDENSSVLKKPFMSFDLWFRGFYFKATTSSYKEYFEINQEETIPLTYLTGLHKIAYGVSGSLFFFRAGNLYLSIKESECTIGLNRVKKDVGIPMKREYFKLKYL